jgi:L-asparagine oxygenase
VLGPPRPILTGTLDEPTFVFDADLMVGTDDRAERTLRRVAEVVEANHASVVLEPGDLLVVDNHLAVHGRSPFTPRFDGTDRWLQRTFVVADLAPSAADRDGRVITTVFGAAA